MDQANIKVGLWNILVILVIIILFVPMLKYGANKWMRNVPMFSGLVTLINSI